MIRDWKTRTIKSRFEFSPSSDWLIDWQKLASGPSISALLHGRFFAHDKVSMRLWWKKKTNKQIELARQVGLGSLEVPYPSRKHFPWLGRTKRISSRVIKLRHSYIFYVYFQIATFLKAGVYIYIYIYICVCMFIFPGVWCFNFKFYEILA